VAVVEAVDLHLDDVAVVVELVEWFTEPEQFQQVHFPLLLEQVAQVKRPKHQMEMSAQTHHLTARARQEAVLVEQTQQPDQRLTVVQVVVVILIMQVAQAQVVKALPVVEM
jgi:hypothetical protein